jgi:membrane protein implicated in regulation of membrane protease activity
MIINTILILVAVAATTWIAFTGFTTGWTLKWVALLILGLLTIIARLDAPRRWKRKQMKDSHSADDSKRI